MKFDGTLSIDEKEESESQGIGNIKCDGSLGIDKGEKGGLRQWE